MLEKSGKSFDQAKHSSDGSLPARTGPVLPGAGHGGGPDLALRHQLDFSGGQVLHLAQRQGGSSSRRALVCRYTEAITASLSVLPATTQPWPRIRAARPSPRVSARSRPCSMVVTSRLVSSKVVADVPHRQPLADDGGEVKHGAQLDGRSRRRAARRESGCARRPSNVGAGPRTRRRGLAARSTWCGPAGPAVRPRG